jgi:flagellar basal-body rod protein FlgF
MDNTIYVGLSSQITLQRELDIAANNLANADTTGYKFEDLLTTADPAAPATTQGVTGPVTFVTSDGVARDYSQGALSQTGGPLDVAIDGKGFFQVSTASGPRYTRDGRFKLDATGKLVTQDDDAVQGDGGDIVLDPSKGPVTISPNGVISQAGQKVAQLSAYTFDDLSALSKEGRNLLRNDSNLPPQPASGVILRQGMLESSNVQPILQITRLIQISRAYEAITNIINQANSLSTTAIQRLGSATA